MRRILLLVTVASMLAAALALSGVAQAAPTIGTKADAKCLAEAAKTVQQPGFNPSDYTFIGGTEGNDGAAVLGARRTPGPDVFCGFGGADSTSLLDAGDIFLGGVGNDVVGRNNGTVYGQEGDDLVAINTDGTFYGGPGIDTVGIGDAPVDGPSGT